MNIFKASRATFQKPGLLSQYLSLDTRRKYGTGLDWTGLTELDSPHSVTQSRLSLHTIKFNSEILVEMSNMQWGSTSLPLLSSNLLDIHEDIIDGPRKI